MILFWIIVVLFGVPALAIAYFVLWMHTWSRRAWAGPGATEVPLWWWLIRKAVRRDHR